MALLDSLDPATRQALNASLLAKFPPAALETLLSDAIRLDIPAGGMPYRQGDFPRTGLVVKGLVRVFMTSQAGRQVTVRYARPGELLGVPALVGGPVPVNVQAVTEISLLMLNTRAIETIARADGEIAWALAEETSQRLYAVLEELAGNTFGSVRERTARHLLNLAAERQLTSGKILIASVTQQEIADAVGSVREVVARALRQLSEEGLLKNTPDGIVILEPAGLLEVSLGANL